MRRERHRAPGSGPAHPDAAPHLSLFPKGEGAEHDGRAEDHLEARQPLRSRPVPRPADDADVPPRAAAPRGDLPPHGPRRGGSPRAGQARRQARPPHRPPRRRRRGRRLRTRPLRRRRRPRRQPGDRARRARSPRDGRLGRAVPRRPRGRRDRADEPSPRAAGGPRTGVRAAGGRHARRAPVRRAGDAGRLRARLFGDRARHRPADPHVRLHQRRLQARDRPLPHVLPPGRGRGRSKGGHVRPPHARRGAGHRARRPVGKQQAPLPR